MCYRIVCLAATALLSLTPPLNAVDYGGEKSFLLETPYQACMVPPQISEAMEKGVQVINLKKAKALYDQKAVFFDAREKRHYQKAHIKGAKPVYFDVSKAEYIAIQVPKDKNVALVFYCYGESCANSYEAALAVRKQGYKNVYWFINGFNAWKEKWYPIE